MDTIINVKFNGFILKIIIYNIVLSKYLKLLNEALPTATAQPPVSSDISPAPSDPGPPPTGAPPMGMGMSGMGVGGISPSPGGLNDASPMPPMEVKFKDVWSLLKKHYLHK